MKLTHLQQHEGGPSIGAVPANPGSSTFTLPDPHSEPRNRTYLTGYDPVDYGDWIRLGASSSIEWERNLDGGSWEPFVPDALTREAGSWVGHTDYGVLGQVPSFRVRYTFSGTYLPDDPYTTEWEESSPGIIRPTTPITLIIATSPALPTSANQQIMWVGRIDCGGDGIQAFSTGGTLRSPPLRADLTIRTDTGSETLPIFMAGGDVPFAEVIPPVGPQDYTTPSNWHLERPGTRPTKLMFNVMTPPTRWTANTLEEITDCVITDELGAYSVGGIRMVTTVPPPQDRSGVVLQTLADFAPVRVPFGSTGTFFVSESERYLYTAPWRYDMTDWSSEHWPPRSLGLEGTFEVFHINPDGSLLGIVRSSVGPPQCVEVSEDGTQARVVFTDTSVVHDLSDDARASDRYVYWIGRDDGFNQTMFRADRATGAIIDTLFFRDAERFPWGANNPGMFGYDSFAVSPDDTIWFSLDGPNDDNLWINQCLARVRNTDGTNNYDVKLIIVQALVEAWETGWAQNYTVGWSTTRQGEIVYPSERYNGEGTPAQPTDSDQGWFLLISPDGVAERIAGSWDYWGNNPPPIGTNDNNNDGPLNIGRIKENDYSMGYGPSRTNFYFLDDGTRENGRPASASMLRVLRVHPNSTVSTADIAALQQRTVVSHVRQI